MPSKHIIDDRSSFVDGPCRPWPSRRRCCSGGASKGGHYIGADLRGRAPTDRCQPHRYGTRLKRRLRVRSSRSRFGSSSGTPGPGVARELQSKSHFKGEAKSRPKSSPACLEPAHTPPEQVSNKRSHQVNGHPSPSTECRYTTTAISTRFRRDWSKCSGRDVTPHREKNGRARLSDLKRGDHPCCI
jgi:hypothetical protein